MVGWVHSWISVSWRMVGGWVDVWVGWWMDGGYLG